MKWVAIVGICVMAAVFYGVVHDQITAQICIEYFTIGHPLLFDTNSPSLVALGWGVIATWWAGFLLGWPLAFAAQYGPRPKLEPLTLIRPISQLLCIMAFSAVMAGLVGYTLAKTGAVFLVGELAEAVPANRHAVFLADLWDPPCKLLCRFPWGYRRDSSSPRISSKVPWWSFLGQSGKLRLFVGPDFEEF